jgi:Uma2 family endonuclease
LLAETAKRAIHSYMSTALLDKPLAYEEERGKPMPSFNHGSSQANLICEFGKDHSFRMVSELTLEINGVPYTPDLSVYPRAPLNLRHDVSRSSEPPLLVVEILSPQQGIQPVMDKLEVYFAFGVKSCWVISPSMHSIQIITADGREMVVNSGMATDPVTGLSADLSVVFS